MDESKKATKKPVLRLIQGGKEQQDQTIESKGKDETEPPRSSFARQLWVYANDLDLEIEKILRS